MFISKLHAESYCTRLELSCSDAFSYVQNRVEQAGGYVWWNRVMGELAISRAIGDHHLRPYVIAEPEVMRMERHSDDKLLILASDGLWDVLSNSVACSLALSQFESALAAGGSIQDSLKKAAAWLTKTALELGSRDNVTVLIVDLRLQTGCCTGSQET